VQQPLIVLRWMIVAGRSWRSYSRRPYEADEPSGQLTQSRRSDRGRRVGQRPVSCSDGAERADRTSPSTGSMVWPEDPGAVHQQRMLWPRSDEVPGKPARRDGDRRPAGAARSASLSPRRRGDDTTIPRGTVRALVVARSQLVEITASITAGASGGTCDTVFGTAAPINVARMPVLQGTVTTRRHVAGQPRTSSKVVLWSTGAGNGSGV